MLPTEVPQCMQNEFYIVRASTDIAPLGTHTGEQAVVGSCEHNHTVEVGNKIKRTYVGDLTARSEMFDI